MPRSFTFAVNGLLTDVAAVHHSNQVLVFITQVGAVGSVLTVRQERGPGGEEFEGGTFSISVTLGRREEPSLQLMARQIGEFASKAGCNKPICLCIGLQDHSKLVVEGILKRVKDLDLWTA